MQSNNNNSIDIGINIETLNKSEILEKLSLLYKFFKNELTVEEKDQHHSLIDKIKDKQNCLKLIAAFNKQLLSLSTKSNVEDSTKITTTTTTTKNNDDNDKILKDSITELIKNKILDGRSLTLIQINQILSDPQQSVHYITIYTMFLNSIDLPSRLKVFTLCSAFENKLFSFAISILYHKNYGFKEVSKVIKILDSKRKLKQLRLKLDNIKISHINRKLKLHKITPSQLDPNNNNSSSNNKQKVYNKKKYYKKNKKTNKAIIEGTNQKQEKVPTQQPLEQNNNNNKIEEKKKFVSEGIIDHRYEYTVKQLEEEIKDLEKYKCNTALNGNISKIFKKWFKSFPEKTLEYFALGQPMKIWREMADLLHLSPKDFQCDWFLPYFFGKDPPVGQVVYELSEKVLLRDNITQEELFNRIIQYQPSYSYIRKKIPPREISDNLKSVIAKYEDLSTVLWWYHELSTFDVDQIIQNRILSEPNALSQMSYGLLLEKAMLFQRQGNPIFNDLLPLVRHSLDTLLDRISLPPPIAVLGDASASMDVAIRLSTIIGSLLTQLTKNSALKFFNHLPIWAPINVKNLNEVFQASNLIKGSGSTCPSAGLYPFYESKQSLSYIILVSDMEENTSYHGYSFCQLYEKYLTEVSPQCKLVFVSFVDSNESSEYQGKLIRDIEKSPKCPKPIIFKLDKRSPDIKKLDQMVTTLSCESNSFHIQVYSFIMIQQLLGHSYFSKYLNDNHSLLFQESLTIKSLQLILLHLFNNNQQQEDLIEIIFKKLLISTSTNSNYNNLYNELIEIQKSSSDPSSMKIIHYDKLSFQFKNLSTNLFVQQSPQQQLINNIDNNNNNEITNITNISKTDILNEMELVILFKYFRDQRSLLACSSVSKLWRKASLNPTLWIRFMSKNEERNLDLVFCIDKTHSMNGEIETVKTKVTQIIDSITRLNISVRLSMVFFSDHSENYQQDKRKGKRVTRVFPFTSDSQYIKESLSKVQVEGGFDLPEAVADGLNEVLNLPFRSNATKVCILISDAAAHGGFDDENLDNHSNGCPCGLDLIKTVRQMANRGISLHTVICRATQCTFDFMSACSEMTEGRSVLLTNLENLADFITNCSLESVYLDVIAPQVLRTIESMKLQFPSITMEEIIYRTTYSLRKQGVRVPIAYQFNLVTTNLPTPFQKDQIYDSMILSADDQQFRFHLKSLRERNKNLLAKRFQSQFPNNNNNHNQKKQLKLQQPQVTNAEQKPKTEYLSTEDIRKICKQFKIY
ncbi:hypothetical protein DLAC_10873 [Tieghemostelium lacteum]|uniref:VWFA domain-containing protein n=1 Tax=Tieghemostelium lacteum TaxID=361077 RepID=A0A151Z2K9_TIELA|nr:hypothetical protein DLAC_10873 [Tieghemostelium lacteum]|eukprot:KYQ88189.1 hypothetical protein DLAC_10873 [Tieghemostelium lacteum]